MLRNKTFAPEFCSLISNWFDMREQAPGGQICCTSLFQEQAPWCVLKFACRDMTCLQLANQIGLFFSSTTHCELTFIVPMPQSGCSFSCLVVSFVCTGWGTYPGPCFGSVFQEQAPSCVPAFKRSSEGHTVIIIPLASILKFHLFIGGARFFFFFWSFCLPHTVRMIAYGIDCSGIVSKRMLIVVPNIKRL